MCGDVILMSAYFIRGINGFGSALISVPLLALSQPGSSRYRWCSPRLHGVGGARGVNRKQAA